MGCFCVHVEATGPHHNGKPYDAEVIATELVRVMKERGHSIQSAHVMFDSGTVIDVLTDPVVLPDAPAAAPTETQSTEGAQ